MAEQDIQEVETEATPNRAEKELVAWVMGHVGKWEEDRDAKFAEKWAEYYRLWRGIWREEDKTRKSERSRIISPALQQAIEVAVAELEEAVFGRGRWFDVDDDYVDPENEDILKLRNLLEEDFAQAKITTVVSEVFLNAALYGTGIAKLSVESIDDSILIPTPVSPGSTVQVADIQQRDKVIVRPICVSPRNFAIDSAAKDVDSALGCAEIIEVPKHKIVERQVAGVYLDRELGSFQGYNYDEDELQPKEFDNSAKLIEYHGLVPASLLRQINTPDEEVELDNELLSELPDDAEDYDLVEAIVTIANDSVLLRAVENPVLRKDRAFIAFPYEIVPNSFWGRGVAEKGYNVQKALDAELRGRIDAMALTIHPMMAVDSTRLVRGGDLTVAPGRNILTNGDPNTVLRPLNFGGVNNNTFSQSGELERMIQMATGAMDSAAPIGVSPRNATASGMSMMLSGMIKRSKRTLRNIEEFFLNNLIPKTAVRYMQFAPDRYQTIDVKFRVRATLGMMARELESQQITQLLNTVPPTSPAYWMLIKNIYELSSITDKDQMLALVDQLLQQTLNPPPPPPDPKLQLDAAKLQMEQQRNEATTQIEAERVMLEKERVDLAKQAEQAKEIATKAQYTLDVAKLQLDAGQMPNIFVNPKIDEMAMAHTNAVMSLSEDIRSIQTLLVGINNALQLVDRQVQSLNDDASAEVVPLRDDEGNLVGVKKGSKTVKISQTPAKSA